MIRTNPWPILYGKILRVGNPEHYVGVATLWSERDLIKEILSLDEFCVIGNLYSAAGINHIIRNVFANPTIRYLVMWGMDMSGSGNALVNFVRNGIDENRQIIGSKGEIEKEIPIEEVNKFRESVELVDARRQSREDVSKLIKGLKPQKPFNNQPKLFPPSTPEVKFLPSEQVGLRVESKTVAQTWLKVLNVVNNYGRIKTTRYASTNELKEILNLTAVVTQEDPNDVYFPEYLPFSQQELMAYYPEWMTSRRLPDMAYNYGERLRNHDGVNQIEEIKKLLQTRPDSKKMIAATIKVKEDWSKVNHGDTPCLTQLICSVQDNKLFITTHFRSQDMFHGWPRNMFAARKLQKEIADSGGYPLGTCTMITHSAHVYADDWKTINDLLDKYYLKELGYSPTMHFQEDPRGNWLVETDEDQRQIVAKLYTPDMQTHLKVFHGPTAKSVYWQIFDWELVSLPSHAFDLGAELQKAEIALRLDISYQQDRPLNFSSLRQIEKEQSQKQKVIASTNRPKSAKARKTFEQELRDIFGF